jgi:hypothetical protein
VAELVQGPRPAGTAAGCLLEQLGCPPVAQSGAAAVGVEVAGRQLDAGAAVGAEHRAEGAPIEQPWQQPGGGGLPDDDVDGVAVRDAAWGGMG